MMAESTEVAAGVGRSEVKLPSQNPTVGFVVGPENRPVHPDCETCAHEDPDRCGPGWSIWCMFFEQRSFYVPGQFCYAYVERYVDVAAEILEAESLAESRMG